MSGTLATVSQHDLVLASTVMAPRSARTFRILALSALLMVCALLSRTSLTAASTGDVELRSCNAGAAIAGHQCTVDADLVHMRGLTLSPDGRTAYALLPSSNAVIAFTRDVTTGALARIPGAGGCVANASLGACTVLTGLLTNPISLAVSPDGASVYVTARDNRAVVVLDRNTATGVLVPKPGASGCVSNEVLGSCTVVSGLLYRPGGVSVSPDGRDVYVVSVDPSSPHLSGAVTVFSRDASTGALTESSCVSSNVRAGCVGGTGEFDVNTAAGQRLVLSPDGSQAFLPAYFSGSLVIFDRNAATGELTLRSGAAGCISTAALGSCTVVGSVLATPMGTTVSPDGRTVYVISGGSVDAIDTVLTLARDPATGALTRLSGPAGCLASDVLSDCGVITHGALPSANFDPTSIAISPDGLSAYVTSLNWNMLLVLDRNPATGVLSQRTGPSACMSVAGAAPCADAGGLIDTPYTVVVSPDGHSVYVSGWGNVTGISSITVFARAVPPVEAPSVDSEPSVPSAAPSAMAARLTVARRSVVASRVSVTLRSVIQVASAGRVQQSVRRPAARRALCSRSATASAAGSLTLTCVMGPSVRASLRRRAVRVQVVTAFTPLDGVPVTTSAWITLPRRR